MGTHPIFESDFDCLTAAATSTNAQYTDLNATPEGAQFATSVFNTMMICNDWYNRALSCDKAGRKLEKYQFRTNRVFKDVLWHILAVKRCNEYNWSGRKRRDDFDFDEFGDVLELENENEEVSRLINLGHDFEEAADDDVTARRRFSLIVSRDYEVFERRIETINIKQMYDEFLGSDLAEILTGSDVDFLSNDFVNEQPFNNDDGRGLSSKVDKAKAQCETQLQRLWLKTEIEHCGKLGSWKRRVNALNNSVYIMQRMCEKSKLIEPLSR